MRVLRVEEEGIKQRHPPFSLPSGLDAAATLIIFFFFNSANERNDTGKLKGLQTRSFRERAGRHVRLSGCLSCAAANALLLV